MWIIRIEEHRYSISSRSYEYVHDGYLCVGDRDLGSVEDPADATLFDCAGSAQVALYIAYQDPVWGKIDTDNYSYSEAAYRLTIVPLASVA